MLTRLKINKYEIWNQVLSQVSNQLSDQAQEYTKDVKTY